MSELVHSARTDQEGLRDGVPTPELLDRLEALAAEPVPPRLEPAVLRALVREAREARRLRRDARDQELINRLRAQELALRWYGDLLDA